MFDNIWVEIFTTFRFRKLSLSFDRFVSVTILRLHLTRQHRCFLCQGMIIPVRILCQQSFQGIESIFVFSLSIQNVCSFGSILSKGKQFARNCMLIQDNTERVPQNFKHPKYFRVLAIRFLDRGVILCSQRMNLQRQRT